jgi:co-chaperonin GroES (HSP10)
MGAFPQIRLILKLILALRKKIASMSKNLKRLKVKSDREVLFNEMVEKGLILPAKNSNSPKEAQVIWQGRGTASESLVEVRRENR